MLEKALKKYFKKRTEEEPEEEDDDEKMPRSSEKWISTFINGMADPMSPQFFFQTMAIIFAFLLFYVLQNGTENYGRHHLNQR